MEDIYVSMSREGEIAFGSFYYSRRFLDYVEGGELEVGCCESQVVCGKSQIRPGESKGLIRESQVTGGFAEPQDGCG